MSLQEAMNRASRKLDERFDVIKSMAGNGNILNPDCPDVREAFDNFRRAFNFCLTVKAVAEESLRK